MKNLTTSEMRKEAKRFAIGDRVTWGNCECSHLVVEVAPDGVYVDVTGEKDAYVWATRRVGDRTDLFVAFDGNNRNKSGRGPITIVEKSKTVVEPIVNQQAVAENRHEFVIVQSAAMFSSLRRSRARKDRNKT